MEIFGKDDDEEMNQVAFIKKCDTKVFLSPSLSGLIDSSQKIMVLSGYLTNASFLEALLKKCSNKLAYIFLFDNNLKVTPEFADKIVFLNPGNIDDYKYFGVTKGKTPILLHKLILECDTLISIGNIFFNSYGGFFGGRDLIFPGLGAEKSRNIFWKNERESIFENGMYDDTDIKDVIVTISAEIKMFGINLLSKRGKVTDIFCGDELISHIKGAEAFIKSSTYCINGLFDGLILETNEKCFQNILGNIKASLSGLKKGGKLLIKAFAMENTGNEIFNGLANQNIDDIINLMSQDKDIKDVYDAFLLKKICSEYNVEIHSPISVGNFTEWGDDFFGR